MKTVFLVRVVTAALALSLASACATPRFPNPFGGNEAESETPIDENRIPLLSAEATLQPSEALLGRIPPVPSEYGLLTWPSEGGNASHNVGHIALGSYVQRAWTKSVGQGSSRKARVSTAPIVADGYVFTLDGAGKISALDEATGSTVWSRMMRSDSKRDKETRGGGLAYQSGRLYVTSGFGYVMALEAASGADIWERDTNSPMHASPTLFQGRLYAVSVDNELFALNADTGAIEWSYRGLAESARILSSSSPAVAGEVVVAPFASGEVIAFRLQNGRPLWSEALTRETGGTALSSLNDIAGSPVISGNLVIAASHSGVLNAFDLVSGQTVWSVPAGGINMPWVADQTVFTISADGQLAALDRSTGAAYWLLDLPRYEKAKSRKGRIAWRGPVLAGGRLIMVSSRGDLWEIAPQDGSIIRQERIGQPVFVPPVVSNGTLYVLDDKARLTALR
jgi:outer membrane protein assembly factor BamB